jgi:hypothetical protein
MADFRVGTEKHKVKSEYLMTQNKKAFKDHPSHFKGAEKPGW